jgi:uncharacterized membrane-anchored protein
MSNELNPKVVKMTRWFLFLAGLLWLLVAVAAWFTSAALSVCVGGVGVALLLIAKYGSGYVVATLRYFNQKNP